MYYSFFIKEIFFRFSYFLFSVFLTFVLFYGDSDKVFFLLLMPIQEALNLQNWTLNYSEPINFFLYEFKIIFYLSFYINLPYFFIQIFFFILPILYSSLFWFYFSLTFLNFCIQAIFLFFVYFLIIPNGYKFFLFYKPFSFLIDFNLILIVEPLVNSIFHFFVSVFCLVQLFFWFFVLFYKSFSFFHFSISNRNFFYFCFFFFGTFLSPPDVTSQLFFSMVFLFFYEVFLFSQCVLYFIKLSFYLSNEY
uniref:SecY-independent transporter protein n=1 Tax=Thraustochytrium aureum TaxID=42467 RepID=Q9G4C9_9STRA|nr:SecY-independent transporter protein [Thraustochytrium aureum]